MAKKRASRHISFPVQADVWAWQAVKQAVKQAASRLQNRAHTLILSDTRYFSTMQENLQDFFNV